MSDQDIITLLTTENTQQTGSRDTILFTQTPTLTTQQKPEEITKEQEEETKVPDIEEIPDEPPKKKSKTGNSSSENLQFLRKKTSILVMIVVNYLQEGMMSRDTKNVDVEKDKAS